MKLSAEQVLLCQLTAGGDTVNERDAPVPCCVDAERHPEISGPSDDKASHQTVNRGDDRSEAVPAGIEVVHTTHSQRADDGRRVEADAGSEREQKIAAVEKVFDKRNQEEDYGP